MVSRLGTAFLEGSVIGAIEGLLKVFGSEKVSLLIENDWYVIGSVFYSSSGEPIKPIKIGEEEAAKAERIRGMVSGVAIPILETIRSIGSRFPPSLVEEKITPEWLKKRGVKKFPELVQVVEDHGEAGERWLRNQCREIVDWALGRSVYSPIHRRMITARDKQEMNEFVRWKESHAGCSAG